MPNEADTCRQFVVPKFQAAGTAFAQSFGAACWGNEPRSIAGQRYFTDGITAQGNVNEIVGKFGGADQFRNAVKQLQSLLYAA